MDLEHLVSFTKDFKVKTNGKCSYVWTPFSDEAKDGIFINMEDLTPLNYSAWYGGQPNGFRHETAVTIWLKADNIEKSYFDRPDHNEACVSCFTTRHLNLHLLGACKWTLLDSQFFPVVHKNDGIVFAGLESSEIR